MKLHTMIFYAIIAVMAVLYFAINKMFGMKSDINIFYYIMTGIVVIAYGLYVNYKNENKTKNIKILFAVCAVLIVADVAVCAYYLPKYTYKQAKESIEERYEEAKVNVDLDFPRFFMWGEHKFSHGCYTFFYDVDDDLYVYNFNQFTGESALERIVEDYDLETAADKIIKGQCIDVESEIISDME